MSAGPAPLHLGPPLDEASQDGGQTARIYAGAAFAFDALDPRLQREEQIKERFARVPVLARVQEADVRIPGPLTPADLPMPASEQYRMLRATLTARRSV